MTAHDVVRRADGEIVCRCGERFAAEGAHEAHWALAAAAEVAPAGLAAARAALNKGDR